MDTNGADRQLMTVADTARHLKRSTEQVRRYLREERLPGRRIGGQWFIERAAVESFGSERTTEIRFANQLKPAARIHPLDSVIGIGEGPGSNIAAGKASYRYSALRQRSGRR